MSHLLYFASQNPNKFREIAALLPEGYALRNLDAFNLDHELPETGSTLRDNALQKARYVAERFGVACFADDSGLEIEALDGAPGVYSARYAGENKNHEANMDKVLTALTGIAERSACFKTVIAYVNGPEAHTFEGEVCGQIIHEKRGQGGFGYDPIFIPKGHSLTFAEMSSEQKNSLSHRAQALQKFLEFLRSTGANE